MLDSICFVKCPDRSHRQRRCWGGTSWKGIWPPGVCWDTPHWTPGLIWRFHPRNWLYQQRARLLLTIITNLEWSFVRSKYYGIPEHDVVLSGSSTNASRWILLARLSKLTDRQELSYFSPTCNLLKSLIRRLLAAVVIVISAPLSNQVFSSSRLLITGWRDQTALKYPTRWDYQFKWSWRTWGEKYPITKVILPSL